ncbi:cupin domain-containing protein [Sneathiella limimaris]|uniref:cupin domain-containing protein n=1 Tax=Sneathiella limimaris TaxID=1964213 RepID=UPI00146EC3AF|nr:cupin domain-containing protein [Sneathiella limimaris]
MTFPIHSMSIKGETENHLPEPFKSSLGKAEWRGLSDQFGLSQFGVNLEVIHPGGKSSLRHWHTQSDEFVYVLKGELTLVTNSGKTQMTTGMCVGFKANVTDAHHLLNETNKSASFIVVGSRVPGDKAIYPDDDFQWIEKDGKFLAAKKDGTPY